MLRFLLRFVGFWLLAAAFVALVYDGTRSVAGEHVVLTQMSETWNALSPGSLAGFEGVVKRSLASWVWDGLLAPILHGPTTLVLAVLGIGLMVLGRKPPPLIGYARR